MLEEELRDMVLTLIEKKISAMIAKDKHYSECVDRLARKEIDPYFAAEEVAAGLLR